MEIVRGDHSGGLKQEADADVSQSASAKSLRTLHFTVTPPEYTEYTSRTRPVSTSLDINKSALVAMEQVGQWSEEGTYELINYTRFLAELYVILLHF